MKESFVESCESGEIRSVRKVEDRSDNRKGRQVNRNGRDEMSFTVEGDPEIVLKSDV